MLFDFRGSLRAATRRRRGVREDLARVPTRPPALHAGQGGTRGGGPRRRHLVPHPEGIAGLRRGRQRFPGLALYRRPQPAHGLVPGRESRPLSIDLANLAVLPASNNVESEADEHSATERSLALIAKLPPDQAEAVMLRIVAGLSVPVTAEIMRRTPGSIRVLCHRGLRRLEELVTAESDPWSATPLDLATAPPAAPLTEMKNA